MRLSACQRMIYVVLILLVLTGCQREISGTYVAKSPNEVAFLQLVKTPDSHLTGRLGLVTLGADGTVNQQSVVLSGVVAHNNIILSATAFGVQTATVSGTLDGKQLTLTTLQPDPLIFQRSDENAYQAEVKALNIRARQIIAAKDNEKFVAETARVIDRMQEFESEVDVHLSRFPQAEESLHSVTTQVSEYVDRERRLVGDPRASVDRGQLDVAAHQASIATDQFQGQLQSLEASLGTSGQTIGSEIGRLSQLCQGPNPADLTPDQIQARKKACDQLFTTRDPYVQKVGAAQQGLLHIKQVYAEENSAQATLLHAADHMQ
jgi:hypothetical protein